MWPFYLPRPVELTQRLIAVVEGCTAPYKARTPTLQAVLAAALKPLEKEYCPLTVAEVQLRVAAVEEHNQVSQSVAVVLRLLNTDNDVCSLAVKDAFRCAVRAVPFCLLGVFGCSAVGWVCSLMRQTLVEAQQLELQALSLIHI